MNTRLRNHFLVFVLAPLFFGWWVPCLASSPQFLIDNGKSNYHIIVDTAATDIDRKAAEELQRYLERVSGAKLPITVRGSGQNSPAIWIGSAFHVSTFPVAIDWKHLEADGFCIKTVGRDLIIAGGTSRGSLYGVYTFLESYVGCRKYSPTAEFVPTKKDILLPIVQDTQVPRISFRDAFFYDPGYMAWHKLDNHADLFGMYVHTFQSLVPPAKYFHDHPEYYTKVKSGRIANAQLCLTNPDVFRIVVNELRERMKLKPLMRYWSVSQNDTFSPCECDSCKAIDSVEGSSSGSLLAFVNRVADEFPDKVISTLAYQYSRATPRTIKPRPNVNIMLCSIECNRSKPLDRDSGSASFVHDLETWRKLTSNIYLWDYVVQFRNLISPFPNLRVLQPNIQLFVRNGVRSVFEQGSGMTPSEMKELRTYIIAKLLWNPDANVDSLMDDFLRGYYGPAAPHIRKYIDTMHDALASSGEDLLIYGYPLPSKNGYLSADNMDKYNSYFDLAEAAVKSDSTFLHRVQRTRLPLQFALLQQAKVYGSKERGFFTRIASGTWDVKPSMKSLLNTFVERCKAFGFTAMEESGTSPDSYYAMTQRFLETSMKNPLALKRSVALKNPARPNYAQGDPAILTDGLRGWEDYNMNWLGFEGDDLEATIDLGSEHSIRRIGTSFLQDINAWIFLPSIVEFAVSEDGRHFHPVADVKNTTPANLAGALIRPFSVDLKNISARYIKVKGVSLKTCPDWHKGAGGLAWLFVDEITVE